MSNASTRPLGITIMQDRCESCLYRLKYPRETRERILSEVAMKGGYVECHVAKENGHSAVMCRGFADADPDCYPLRMARRLGAIDRTDYIHTITGER